MADIKWEKHLLTRFKSYETEKYQDIPIRQGRESFRVSRSSDNQNLDLVQNNDQLFLCTNSSQLSEWYSLIKLD